MRRLLCARRALSCRRTSSRGRGGRSQPDIGESRSIQRLRPALRRPDGSDCRAHHGRRLRCAVHCRRIVGSAPSPKQNIWPIRKGCDRESVSCEKKSIAFETSHMPCSACSIRISLSSPRRGTPPSRRRGSQRAWGPAALGCWESAGCCAAAHLCQAQRSVPVRTGAGVVPEPVCLASCPMSLARRS